MNKRVERILLWLVQNYPEYWFETITHLPVDKPYFNEVHLFSWLKSCRTINGWTFGGKNG